MLEFFFESIAQMVERNLAKVKAVGSNPTTLSNVSIAQLDRAITF
jgi:hypothetical protein